MVFIHVTFVLNHPETLLLLPTPPKSHQLMITLSDWNNIDDKYHYHYECPIHGQLTGVPDEEMILLQGKARLAMKK